MHRRTRCLALMSCVALASIATAARATPVRGVTPLENYVYTPDPAFGYTLQDTVTGPGYTAYVLLMDSLRWRSDMEVDRTLWTHQVIVLVPDNAAGTTALMIVNGGSDANAPLDPTFVTLGAILATASGSIIAAVSQIPNQPLLFPDELDPISEDHLVAYSWDKAMATGDAQWAAYLPMTKASVRALDAVQTFVNDTVAGHRIDDFVVTGFSKRGATAYLVAAVDPRVRAVAPGVFDVLDLPQQIERHYRAYGFYAPAVGDYVAYDIVRRVRSPEGRWLTGIVDPLSYAKTLQMPKFLLHATGDQFFLPDAANYYVDALPGETLIRQVANTDHGFTDHLLDGLDALLAWYGTTLDGSARPSIDWSRSGDGTLSVTSQPPAEQVTLWQATNADARDFRLESLGAQWTDTPLTPDPDGRVQVPLTAPTAGWTGYLVELRFAGDLQQTYSTPVFVAPDTLPFELNDPIAAPRQAPYWACQLPVPAKGCPVEPDFTPDELAALLPFSVFGEYQHSLDDLIQALTSPQTARRACTATRLNIAAGRLGWYSPITRLRRAVPLWQIYAEAETHFADGAPQRAAIACATLNRSGGPPASAPFGLAEPH